MKVCINYLEINKDIGPMIFAQRLARELNRQGIEIVRRHENHDILLAVIRETEENIRNSRKKGAKIVQRLDSIYYHLDEDFDSKNQSIKQTYNQVDAVIFQTDFCKRIVQEHFGMFKGLSFIINNGVASNEFPPEKPTMNKKIFIASARWRPTKRLDDTIQGFLYANIPSSELWILGPILPQLGTEREYKTKFNDRGIRFFGEISPTRVSYLYNQATGFIHLCYDDACPNVVVEALVSQVPVICTNNGGTKELVKDSGEILQSEPTFDLKPYFLSAIPKVKKEQVCQAIHLVLDAENNKYEFPRPDLYINSCAKNYTNAFQQILDS